MILDRNKTVDKILNSDFPTDLLNALTALDNALATLEKSNPDNDEKAEIDPVLVQELLGGAVVAAMAFRNSWAVYKDEEEVDA